MKHCGLRKGYANGGLLDSLDERMGWGKYAQAATAPTAMQQAAAAESIEQAGAGQKFARLQEQADSIGGNYQLSNRQKARALSGLQQAAGATGALLDLPGVSGLSARQKLEFDTGNMQAENSVTDFNTRSGLRATTAAFADSRRPGIGFKQGGTVDGKGYIHGEKGVDKVPAKVAETGEDILVSDGERIVNKKQNAALERLAAEAGMSLDEYLERSTGEPVGPQMKQGLRAAQGGWEVDPAGNVRRPGQSAGALPNPNTGGPIAVRNNTAWTSGGGGFKADPGAIDVDFKPVPPQPMTLPAPAPTPTPPRTDLPYRAGQAVGKGVDWLKNNKGAALGYAGDALAVYNAHKLASEHDDFYNSTEVPVVEKGLQAGRDIAKTAIPFVAGAIGAGAGTVASPTLVVNPVTGGLAGYAAGTAAVSGIDKEGQALKDFKAKNTAGADIRAKHEAVMNDTTGHKSNTPIVTKLTDAEKKVVKGNVEQAKVAAQADKPVDWLADQGVNVKGLRRNVMEDMNRVNANGPDKVAAGELRQVNTANGPVYAARDKNGQLIVTAGLERTPEQQAAATKSGYDQAVAQAQKDKDSLARIQRERAEFDAFDPSITDPVARQNGLRKVAMYMMQDEAAGKALQHREDRDAMLGLRRDMLEEQKRQFDETASVRRDIAASAAKERGIQNMEKLFEFSGLKGDRANNFRQFVYQNHADNLSALPHEQQLKVLPRLIADFEDAEIRNANSTNGTSWQNQKVKRKDNLNFEEDAAYDPNGVFDQRVWFGSGEDGKGLGKANILLRKYGPTALFGSDSVDVMEDGQRVMSKDNRGERGMLGSRQMKEINRLSLRDAQK